MINGCGELEPRGALLPALASCADLVHRFWWTCDDAFISFRYTRNLARGGGLTYNPTLEDYTNFLWTGTSPPGRHWAWTCLWSQTSPVRSAVPC